MAHLIASMAVQTNVCADAGYPCFTPNPKDSGMSSLIHTCGPVPDMFSCSDLGSECYYDFSLYTCEPVKCPKGSFDGCNAICLADDAAYQDDCTNNCQRACSGPAPPSPPPSPPSPPPVPSPPAPPPSPPSPPPAGCANKAYGQCGGQGWTGPTCCPTGSTCSASGDYYSQCKPTSLGLLSEKLSKMVESP